MNLTVKNYFDAFLTAIVLAPTVEADVEETDNGGFNVIVDEKTVASYNTPYEAMIRCIEYNTKQSPTEEMRIKQKFWNELSLIIRKKE